MQLLLGSQVKSFESILKKKYNFEEYTSVDKPTLFWGIYSLHDLDILRRHKGVKIVSFNGTDSTNKKVLRLLRTYPESKDSFCISGSDWVADDLNKAFIKHIQIPLLMSDVKIWQPYE